MTEKSNTDTLIDSIQAKNPVLSRETILERLNLGLCIRCGKSEQQTPLRSRHYLDVEFKVCSKCLGR